MKNHTDIEENKGFGWERYEAEGRAFICAEGTFRGEGDPTEDELCTKCIEESDNPQND